MFLGLPFRRHRRCWSCLLLTVYCLLDRSGTERSRAGAEGLEGAGHVRDDLGEADPFGGGDELEAEAFLLEAVVGEKQLDGSGSV